VSVAPRASAPGFGATVIDTTPAPFPAAPEAIVIHGTSLRAVQAQPACAATETSWRPPAAGTVAVDRSRRNWHAAAA
jgi:hypothetical protein